MNICGCAFVLRDNSMDKESAFFHQEKQHFNRCKHMPFVSSARFLFAYFFLAE